MLKVIFQIYLHKYIIFLILANTNIMSSVYNRHISPPKILSVNISINFHRCCLTSLLFPFEHIIYVNYSTE